MKSNKTVSLRRLLCAALALVMVISCMPWIEQARAADVPKTVYSQDFDDAEEGYVGTRLGGWDVIANGEGSVVEVVDSGDVGHAKVMKITQPGDKVNDIILDYALPGTTGYTDVVLSFDIRMSAGARLNNVGLRGGTYNNPRASITVKDGKFCEGTSAAEIEAYTADTWYQVEIRAYKDAADSNQYYDLWINGTKVVEKQKPHDNAALKGIMIHVSKWSAATVMVDNVVVYQMMAAPQTVTEDFEAVDTSVVTSVDQLEGWTIHEHSANSTAKIKKLEGDSHGQVLAMELAEDGVGKTNLWISRGVPELDNVELRFELYTTQGVRINDMGLYGPQHTNPRTQLGVSKGYFGTNANDPATNVAVCEPGKWYALRAVFTKNSITGSYNYDIYLDDGTGEVKVINQATAAAKTKLFGVLLSKWSANACSVYIDNIQLTQLPARLATEAYENLPVGKVNVLEGWNNKTAARGAVAAVTKLEDAQHGNVLSLYQTGKETDNSDGAKEMRLLYALDDRYDYVDISMDLWAKKGIFSASMGNHDPANWKNSWPRVSVTMRDQKFKDVSGADTGHTYTDSTWYNVKMCIRTGEDGNVTYDAYVDGTKIIAGKAANAKALMTCVLLELSRSYAGTVYVDNLVVSTVGPEDVPESDGSDAVQFVGLDKTTGSQWIGVYGAKQAILPAKNVADEPNFTKYDTSSGGVTFYRQVVKDGNDFYSNTTDDAIKVSYNTGGGWWCLPAATHGLDLQTPEGAGQYASLLNAYCMAGFTVDNDQQTTFKFTVPDGKMHQLTVFGSNPTKETGQVRFVFLDADGKQIGSKTLAYSDFEGGAYVSFLVEGSFTLRIDKLNAGGANKARYFGMGAFFFDEVPANFTSDLKAELAAEARSIDLTWTETGAPEGSKIMIFRKTADEGYAPIATVDAGVKAYHDTGLEAGQTYAYKLCCVSGNTYSAYSKEVACTVAAYAQGVLTLDQTAYTVLDSTQDVTVLATVKDTAGTAYEGVEISVKVSWEFDPTDTQTYTAQTNAEGVAIITFKPEYMGDAVLTVKSADHDAYKLSGAEETVTLFVGQKSWTAAPVIYRISEGVAPGQTLGIYGYGMYESGSETDVNVNNVTIYYAPHTGATAPAEPAAGTAVLEVLQSDYENGTYLMAELPAGTAGGLYDVWVKNAYGYSKPVVLNAARPLFISEYEAWAGQTIQVSGRNLDATQFGAARNTQLRLVPVGGGEAVAQTLTKLTPYSMAFTVSGAAGEYYVEVTNDGITWARPHSGQTLTIVAEGNDFFDMGLAWMDSFRWNTVIDVTDHGANGGDEASDKAAFEAAVAAAKAAGGGVVYIPDGTYYLDQLLIPSHVVLMGQSMDGTVIVYNGDGSKANFLQGDAATRDEGYLGFARFTVRLADETKRPDAFFWLGHDWVNNYAYDQRIRTADNFFLYQIRLDSADTAPTGSARGLGIVALGDERMVIRDCLFEGFNVGMGSNKMSRYVTLKDNEWYLESGNVSISANYSFVEGNYVKGRYTELSDEEVTGNTHGLCFSAWCHLEDNFVEKMGSKVNLSGPSGEFNDGETYLPECQEHFESGFVVNATENSVTVRAADGKFNEIAASSRAWSRNRLCVVIMAGRGMGQLKTIGDINYATGVITLAESERWDVMPDSTSVFSINLPLECNTMYNNREATSSKGVYFYQDTVDCVIANHVSEDTLGISIFAPTVNANRVKAAYYVTVRDCVVKGYSTRAQAGHISVNTGREYVGTYYATTAFGIELRDNAILGERNLDGRQSTEAAAESGIVLRAGASHMPTDSEDGDITAVIVEGNTLSNLDVGVTYTVQNYGVLLKDNTFYGCGKTTNQWLAYQDDEAVIRHLREINSVVKAAPVVASVDGKELYTSLDEAIRAAGEDETVRLMTDLAVDALVIPAGKTVDLCGYELTAEYVVAFSGAQLVDSVGEGLLKCSRVRLEADNPMLPVWVEADGGYRFFTMKDSQLYYTQSTTGFVFIAKPVLGKAANAPYMALANNGLSVKARMSWKSAGGNVVEQFFVLKGEDVQSIYSDKNQIIQLTVNGAGSYIGRLSTTMVIESETGVIWAGVPLLYTGN